MIAVITTNEWADGLEADNPIPFNVTCSWLYDEMEPPESPHDPLHGIMKELHTPQPVEKLYLCYLELRSPPVAYKF